MAEVVGDIPPNKVHNAKYAWDDWLDGRAWKFKRGEDFSCAIEAFRSQAWLAATKRGVTIKTRKAGNTIYIQAKGRE